MQLEKKKKLLCKMITAAHVLLSSVRLELSSSFLFSIRTFCVFLVYFIKFFFGKMSVKYCYYL